MYKLMVLALTLFPKFAQAASTNHEFLFGKWEGSGWILMPEGRVELAVAEECVYGKFSGGMAVVEGRHKNSHGQVVFKTFGVLTQKDSTAYDFGIYLDSRYKGQYSANIDANTQLWKWSRDVPVQGGNQNATVRYTISIKNDTWHEIGEFSRDGGLNWQQTFEMNLKRTTAACGGFD